MLWRRPTHPHPTGARWLPAPTARWAAVGLVTTLAALAPLPAAHASHATPGTPATLPPPSAIQLRPSLASPQPLGTPITWTASASDTVPLVYRFGVALNPKGPYLVVRDFSVRNSFVWAPLQEGTYYVAVSVQEGYSGTATSSTARAFTLTSRVSGTQAVVSPTANPLVALYSAPACATGYMVVRFRQVGSPSWTYTTAQSCPSGLSRNFLVAGMRASTTYQLQHLLVSGGHVTASPLALFTTGALPPALVFPSVTVPQPPDPGSDGAQGIIYHDLAGPAANEVNPMAVDLQGRVVWYTYQPDLHGQDGVRIQRVSGRAGDEVMVFGSDNAQSREHGDANVFRIIDLAGDPLRETNVQAINQQLLARGQRIIYSFSHDALVLPNGDIATLGHTQAVITTTAVMGDMLLVLNRDLQVVWSWDAFDHLNPFRGPTLGDICGSVYRQCPVPGGPNTIDWTHANAIDYTPADGNLLISLRAQDWIIKINYSNGSGDGRVLWRLGAQGDFALVPLSPADPFPWFSHQHDANFVAGATLAVFDNGNTRCAGAHGVCHSRGQAYTVNEQTKVVTQTVNADLGGYSDALGVAQRLSNGNYNFTSGAQNFPPPAFAQEIEVLPSGVPVFVQQINHLEYRAWRLASLYAATNAPCSGCSSTP